jgi:hypothetical protein
MSAFVNAIDVAYYPRLRTGKGKDWSGRDLSPEAEYVCLRRYPPAPNRAESIADCSEIIRHACGCILDFSPMPKVHVQEQSGPSLALSDSLVRLSRRFVFLIFVHAL